MSIVRSRVICVMFVVSWVLCVVVRMLFCSRLRLILVC